MPACLNIPDRGTKIALAVNNRVLENLTSIRENRYVDIKCTRGNPLSSAIPRNGSIDNRLKYP